MICPNCRRNVADGSAFCENCGIALPTETATNASPPADKKPETEAAAIKPNAVTPAPKAPANPFQPQAEANMPQPKAEANMPQPKAEANMPQRRAVFDQPEMPAHPDIFAPRDGKQPPAPPTDGSQQAANPPRPAFFAPDPLFPPVSVGNWILTFLLLLFVPLAVSALFYFIAASFLKSLFWLDMSGLAAPIAYIIMLLIYAFCGKVNPSKRNFFRAVLIISLILLLVGGILLIVFGSYLLTYLNDAANLQQLGILLQSV